MSEPHSDDRDDQRDNQNLFTRKDCEDIWNRVRLLLHWRYGYLAWRGVYLEGIIADVMIEESEGRSERKRPEHVSIEIFLYQSVRSKLGHMLEREKWLGPLDGGAEEISEEDASSRFKNPARGARRRERQDDSEYIPRARKPPHNPRPEKIHEKAERDEVSRKILEIVGDDMILRGVVEKFRDDLRPREIAKELGITIEEERCAQTRLARRISKLRKEWGYE